MTTSEPSAMVHDLLRSLADEEGRLIALLVDEDPDPHQLGAGSAAIDAVLAKFATLPPESLLGAGTDLATARATALRLAEALHGQAVLHRNRLQAELATMDTRAVALGAYGITDDATPIYVDRVG
jgi:hypothetical protein